MTAVGRGVAAQALAILAGGCCDPAVRRRAETYVQALPQADLEAVFVALPVLDGIVRHEIHTRSKAAPAQCEVETKPGGIRCRQARGHRGDHSAPLSGSLLSWGP